MPIVRESQVGSLLKMFWPGLDFMIIAFAKPKGAGVALNGGFLDKGVRFFGKDWFGCPTSGGPNGCRLARDQGAGGNIGRRRGHKGKLEKGYSESGNMRGTR